MIPPRAWLLPPPDLSPGCGVWKAENTGSAEMVGAVEYAPVSEVERLREALEEIAEVERTAYSVRDANEGMNKIGEIARAALQGATK